MPITKIVLNASPLILLVNCEMENILPAMFQNIVIPERVLKEISVSKHPDRCCHVLSKLHWLHKKSVTALPEIIQWDLGPGETDVISFAVKHHNVCPVVDDLQAKKCINALGLKSLGTGSLLILAKKNGLIDSVEQSLRRLQHAGLWISEPVIEMLKKRAGEN